jgi:hypothetical protein
MLRPTLGASLHLNLLILKTYVNLTEALINDVFANKGLSEVRGASVC